MTDISGSEPPYEIHTGRELDLMLKRRKPLAHFCDYYPPEPDEEIVPRAAFVPHVRTGRIVERAYVDIAPLRPPIPGARGVLHVLYALTEEAWRIDAYIQMQFESARSGWCEQLERLEGTLLGYTDREIGLHIEYLTTNPVTQSWPWVKRIVTSRGQT